MLTLETLEKYAVSVHQLALSLDQRVTALESKELAATDSQQLKAAIALVRKHAGLHLSIQDLNLTNQCLDLVEQRATV